MRHIVESSAQIVVLAAALICVAAVESSAGEVTVTGVHLCCGQCEFDAAAALKGVEGVAEARTNRDAKRVVFTARDGTAASAGVEALAKAGFHGRARHGDQRVPFPPAGAKEGEKADSVTLAGLHVCCRGCVEALQQALGGVRGVTVISVDQKAKTATASGRNIDVTAAAQAVFAAGFHGTLKREQE